MGASYGGLAGHVSGSKTLVYGDVMNPVNFGSGSGAPGGGILSIKVDTILNIEGK